MILQPAPNEVVLHAPAHRAWLYFRRPAGVITATRPEDVLDALSEVENQVDRQGRYAAGWLTYEAAPAFDQAFQVRPAAPDGPPLLWFGLYDEALTLPSGALPGAGEALPGPWQPDISEAGYRHALRRIKGHIARGDTYQVNFTYRLRTPFNAPAWPVFAALANAHAAPYAAFVETRDWAVCSISPELFFHLDGDTLTGRPMKGTAPRGRTLEEDQRLAAWLWRSVKNRAENVMIVDMLRNDMGRIARVGSVQVPDLFTVEKYPTVWQMTSTVQAKTDAGLCEVFRALYPCASITGAPKVRTMQIIAELETGPRQLYTGAIGFFAPGRRAQFNVAIRTLLVDKRREEAEYGVGGGIVWDSRPGSEWQETIAKARILHELPSPFDLLETMRWTPQEGWFLLEKHLQRLKRSAEYFSYPLDERQLRQRLSRLETGFERLPQRVRLTLSADGRISLEHRPLSEEGHPLRVGLARTPVSSADRFLYHKTTRREVYQRALAECPGCDEALLWNERGEVTEATIANMVVELDGELVTPPVKCGLLPGTYRAWLLESGRVKERTVRVEDLQRCSRIYLVNSVRGMWEVRFEGPGV